MALTFRKIESPFELLDRIKPWLEFLSRAGYNNIFYHPLWHLAWLDSIGLMRKMEFFLAEENGEWLGILPLVRFRSLRDGFLRVLEFSGGTQADYHDLLVVPGYENKVLDLFSGPFQELQKKVSLVRLHTVSSGSLLLKWDAILKNSYKLIPETIPYLPLREGLDYSELEENWSSSHRLDIRRQIRRLNEIGALSLERIESVKEASGILSPFLKTHNLRWQNKDLSIKIYNRMVKKFMLQLINRLWSQGFIHFSVLRLNGKPISYHFGFIYEGVFYWYKPAYVLKYQKYSPGKVHVAKLIGEGLRERWKCFDFLLGDENYKSLWTKEKCSRFTIIKYN